MVFSHNEIHKELANIKESITEKMKHSYIMKYIDVPVIDEDKLLLLYIMYREKRIAEDSLEDYLITTMLVQIALDTHESVSLQSLTSDYSKKNRQLTVLAGDYYSGLYYHLLAELSDLTMIRILAQAIQEMNENKMQFYQNDNQETENAIENIRRIEASLLLKTAEHLHLPLWKGIADEFLLIKRLLTERKSYLEGRFTPLLVKISKHLQTNKNINKVKPKQVLSVLDSYIKHSRLRIEKFWLEQPTMKSFLEHRLDYYFKNAGFIPEFMVEEG
jgi:heptaprenyl diphosphate synthase